MTEEEKKFFDSLPENSNFLFEYNKFKDSGKMEKAIEFFNGYYKSKDESR